jgi:CheY-like chemotaxis protein
MNVKKIVAIVDDDADDRDTLRDVFISANTNCHCLFFENGEVLVRHIKETPDKTPELILLDLNMPGMDGREVLKALKSTKEFATIPIVVFTTSSSPHDKKLAYALGANCFVTKPDTFQKMTELAACISRLWL